MKNIFFILRIVMGLAVGMAWIQSFAGTNVSGGAFSVREAKSERATLIDFYEESLAPGSEEPGATMNLGRVAAELGYERRELADVPASAIVDQQINLWKENSPIIMGLLRETIRNVEWRFTHYQIPVPELGYTRPGHIPKGAVIEPVVYYTELFGALITVSRWNELGRRSQAGVLIHEALRQMQIAYGVNLGTDKIQKLTAAILLATPTGRPSLDSEAFLDGPIHEWVKLNNNADAKKLLELVAPFLNEVLEIPGLKQQDKNDLRLGMLEFQEKIRTKGDRELEYTKLFLGLELIRNSFWVIPMGHPLEADQKVLADELYVLLSRLNRSFLAINTILYKDARLGLSSMFFGIAEDKLIAFASGQSQDGLRQQADLAVVAKKMRMTLEAMSRH